MKLKIISDGTNVGTKLVDMDTGETVHLVQKIIWEANALDTLSKVTIELLNVPVEITSKAEVDLFDYDKDWELKHSKSFEKEIKIMSVDGFTKIFDTQTQNPIGAIQEIKWEATPEGSKAKVKKIKFDNNDW